MTVRAEGSISIGCQDHSVEYWRDADVGTIAAMDPEATEFWAKYRDTILALAGVGA